MSTKQIHFNRPQIKSMMIGAPSEVAIFGRGTGKTEGLLAPKSSSKYLDPMPRGTGVIVATSHTQQLTRTLPALIAGWERLGYVLGRHYQIGTKPSEKWKKLWNWKGPYRPPLDYKYFISWWNGAGAHLVSQDIKGSSNGITIDWIIGDEAKFLNQEKLKTELFPANRGIIPAFASNPYHHGITFTTDMPVGTSGRWLLDMEKQMDRNVVNRIWELQCVRFKLRYFLKNPAFVKQQKEIAKQIVVVDEEMNILRKGLLYYHEASTLENIDALGIDYIKQQMRGTSVFQFDTQILNIRPLKLEDGFYPDFDEEKHGYYSEDPDYLDSFNYDFSSLAKLDCRKDRDRVDDLPLHIALDYNRRIHPLVVGQVPGNEIRTIKGLHAMYPGKLREVLDMFVEYYKPHKRKFVYYWYDATATSDQHESMIWEDVVKHLRKHEWIVKPMYMGKPPAHEIKYRMWGDLLSNNGKYNKTWTVNRENCDKLILSMYKSQAEVRKDGFGKDKKSEKDENFPADESTHYSDAEDQLVFGLLESKLPYGNEQSAMGGMMMI